MNIYAPALVQRDSAEKSVTQTCFSWQFNCVIEPENALGNYAYKKCDPLKQLVQLLSYSDAYKVAHPSGGGRRRVLRRSMQHFITLPGPKTCLSKLIVEGVEEEDKLLIQDKEVNYFTRLYNGQHRSRPNGGPSVDTRQPFQACLSFKRMWGNVRTRRPQLEVPISLAELEACEEPRYGWTDL